MQLLLNLLWSLNERAVGRAGADFAPPSLQWVADVAEVDAAHAREIRAARKKAKRKAKKEQAEAERQAAFDRGYQ